MAWATPYTFTAGYQPTAAKWNEQIRDNLNIIAAAGISDWASYTATWQADTTNPTLGNGTAAGLYQQLGKLVVFSFLVQAGSTTTFGTGNYKWALPVTAETTARGWGAKAVIADPGVATYFTTVLIAAFGTADLVALTGSPLAYASPTSPMTWAVNDNIRCTGFYEAA